MNTDKLTPEERHLLFCTETVTGIPNMRRGIPVLLQTIIDLRADLAESVATFENEQGRGDPPCAIPTQSKYDKGGQGWHMRNLDLGGVSWEYYYAGRPFLIVHPGGYWQATCRGLVGEGPPQVTRASKPSCRQAMREAYAAMGKHSQDMRAYFERTYRESHQHLS